MITEVICGFLFVISSGLLFNERYRANKVLVVITAIIAIISTYFLTKQIAIDVVKQSMAEASETPKEKPMSDGSITPKEKPLTENQKAVNELIRRSQQNR